MDVTAKFSTKDLATVFVSITDENGMVESKAIRYQDFSDIINMSRMEEDLFRTGQLPKGYWDGYISVSNPSTFKVVVVVPEARRLLNYYGESFEVPFPALTFLIATTAGKVNVSKVFAVLGQNIAPESTLYHYPYGNVYDDGKICWGQNILDSLPSIRSVDGIVALFFGSETNDDLFKSSKYSGQREMILSVAGKKSFHEHWLEKSHYKLGGLLE